MRAFFKHRPYKLRVTQLVCVCQVSHSTHSLEPVNALSQCDYHFVCVSKLFFLVIATNNANDIESAVFGIGKILLAVRLAMGAEKSATISNKPTTL